jgi:hypothetical protein
MVRVAVPPIRLAKRQWFAESALALTANQNADRAK